MKRILFVLPSLQNGGTVTTLKNTLPYIDRRKCQIDIFPITNSGPNYDYISRYATILGARIDNSVKKNKTTKDKAYTLLYKIVKGVKKILCHVGCDISVLLFKKVAKTLEKTNYDTVIAFQEGQATRLGRLIQAKRKVAWIHCDYSTIGEKEREADNKEKAYKSFDKIVCVSKFTQSQFVKCVPEAADRTVAIHNLMSADTIKIQALEDPKDVIFNSVEGLKIVSLGRLHPVKRFSTIPEIAMRLKEKGLLFNWFIIGGDDSDKELIERNIEKFDVADCVKLLGNKNNPYPYIKNSDALVCTSLSEACPNVLNEAKILGIPIVSTNFGSVVEMMSDGVEGLIAPIEQLDEAIYRLFSEDGLFNNIKDNIARYRYDNKEILKRLSKITLLEFVAE